MSLHDTLDMVDEVLAAARYQAVITTANASRHSRTSHAPGPLPS